MNTRNDSRLILHPSDLKGDLRAAVIDLLYRMADDEIVIGHRNSEWTGLGPILEADIAFSSMAQDEMGHALAYYRLLHDLGEADPDTNAFGRSPGQYRCASLVALAKGDWAFSIVRQFLYDAAESLRLDALADSAYEPLAIVARKLRGEEKYHSMHGRTMMARLGPATVESHTRMQAAVDKAWPHALGLFEPTRWNGVLAESGVAPREEELLRRWRDSVTPILTEAKLTIPNAAAIHGGRTGKHPPELAELLNAMTKVYRLDPAATW